MRIALLILVLVSTSAIATPTWYSSKVSTVYPQSNGTVVVSFIDDDPACTNANNPKYYSLGIGLNGVSEEGFKNMYSAVLVAAASGKEVTINFDSSSVYCEINRLSVAFQ